jgi:hypothetical protein
MHRNRFHTLGTIGFERSGLQAGCAPCFVLAVPGCTFLKFHFRFSRVGRCPAAWATAPLCWHATQENAMRLVFIIAIMFLGITTAQGQTVLPLNGQTNGGASAANTVGSNPLGVSTFSSPSMSSPSASQFGTPSGSSTTGSASGAAGATSSASGTSQSPLLLPGEIPDTSTQAASTTATAPSAPSPICPPPIPSTDGGSANLTDIAGASLNGC